ncbi:efflux RND transporter permease subunit [Marivirga arenosa]|uniref:MMPL family transporter n=1 Tax=Marivirga arenosa TaxID=3059076 RepID=A0AA51X465_9BACT|nr:MMPL family transporter [Marivirga sp. BKB1-2]WNB17213.1 MMPL family transporter [Marivirga sp. BKB1-2]
MKKIISNYYNNFKDKEFRVMLYAVWIISLAFFISQFPKLSVSFEFEKFFAEGNEDRVFFEQHVEKFGYDNDYLLVAIQNSPSIFQSSFLQKLEHWTNSIDSIDGIQSARSLFELKHIIKAPFGYNAIPLLHVDDENRLKSDSVRISSHDLYSKFISNDAQSTIIQLNHRHFTSPKEEFQFFNKLKVSLQENNLSNYRIVGKLVAQQSFVDHIKSDFSIFLAAGIGVTILLLLLIYRSFNIMLLPLMMSISSLIYLLGFMAMFQVELSILSVLIPPIILFVSTSDAIHLINAYRQNPEQDFIRRLKLSIKKVFSATLLTSITTAVGFFSLLVLPTEPINELGLFAGIGVLIAFVVNFAIGPLLIRKNYRNQQIKLPFRKWTVKILKNRRAIILVYLLIVVVSFFGVFKLKTDAYLLKDLPKNSQVRDDFTFMDRFYGGSKPWEMAIYPADKNETILNYDILVEILKIEQYLKDSFKIENVVSPLELVKYANQIENGGVFNQYKLPNELNYDKQKSTRKFLLQKGIANNVVDSSLKYGRFTGFIPEWGSNATQKRNDKLREFIKSNIDSKVLDTKLTGTTYLIDKSNENLSIELIKGLVFAIFIIALFIAIYFKSFKMLLISLIPNVIPLILTAGLMGFMEVPLKLTTAIIFVVSFGIAVDDTIHFLGSFKKQTARSPIWRIIKTLRSAGLAILITSILIIGGFVLFTFSSFATTFYLGFFLTFGMFIALVTDIVFLPIILR